MKDEKWLRAELKELAKDFKENARENRRQAKDCAMSEPKRAEWLEGGAESMDYAAGQVARILKGQTSIEALTERLIAGRKMRNQEA